MNNFHNVNLPKYIEIFAVGTVEFSNFCVETKSGREVRDTRCSKPRRKYFLKNCRLSKAQFNEFNSFFYARGGKRFSFRLKDYGDYSVEKQFLAKGDGISKEFQLIKSYDDLVAPYVQKIITPVAKSIKIYKNNNLITPQSIDQNTGKLILAESLESEMNLLASFEFDVPVRFEKDGFQYSFNTDGTISLDDVHLIEVM